MGRARRAAMRLLPVGPGHGRCRSPQGEAEPDRQGHRRGDAPGGGPDEKGESMKNPSRRKFIIDSALVSGGLAVGINIPFIKESKAKTIGAEVNAWVVVNPD